MEETLNLNEFFVEGGDQETSHVLLHLTEPSTPEEKAKGYFFAVAELNHAPAETIASVQTLIDDIENAYYETPDLPDHPALESIIAGFNTATNLTSETAGKLHCLVGALRGEEILFTYAGRPLTLLFYKNRQGGYNRMDLLEGGGAAEDPAQLFQQFIQGKVSAGDFMILGTPHLGAEFNPDRLEKIVTTRAARDSAEHLERVLGGLNNNFSYGGLIVNRGGAVLSAAAKKLKPLSAEVSSSQSLRQLLAREKNTSETLSPSFLPRVQAKLKQAFNPLKPLRPSDQNSPHNFAPINVNASHLQTHRPRPRPAAGQKLPEISKKIIPIIGQVVLGLTRGLIYFAQLIWLSLIGLARLFGSLFFIITNAQDRRRTILENWSREWRGRKQNFVELPLVTKIVLAAIIFGLAALAGGIIIVRHNAKVTAEQTKFDETVALINLKKDAVDSALIYHDEPKARSELTSANALLKGLACSAKTNAHVCLKLTAQLSDLSVKLSRLVPAAVSELAAWKIPNEIQLNNLVKMGSKLVATTASSSRLYIYDLVTRQANTVETGFIAGAFTVLAAPKENDYAVVVVNQKDVYILDPADWHLKKADVSFPRPVQKITAAVVYNRRLYILDAGANKIYKHDAIKNGFGAGQDWIQTPSTSVRDGVDIAIDGDVYVLGSNGAVQKFTAGVLQTWSLPMLEPALTRANHLYTYNDIENLYLLDPIAKRLIVFKKTGELKVQLQWTSWLNPADMVIDEPAHTAYVADGNAIYKVDLPK